MIILFCISFVTVMYFLIGFNKIIDRYKMYLSKSYWTDYNIIELMAWMAKAIIIIPGLIFKIEVWQLYFLTLFTSICLIWASMRKSLPTLILFNTIWVLISIIVIWRNIF